MELENITQRAIEIIRETGLYIKAERMDLRHADIEVKAWHDYVTYVDKTSEQMLYNGLKDMIPGATFLAEEGTVRLMDGKTRWIIDPLDGTTNYIHNIPVFCISVALEVKGDVKVGIVYEINNDEMFYTYEGGFAFLNGKRIKVSDTEDIKESLIATGFPYSDYSRLESYMKFLTKMIETGRGIRRLGSAAADLAYVACGRFDAFFEYGLKPWDVAAGAYLVKQAGGHVSGFTGEENYVYGNEILATNMRLNQKFCQISKDYFGNYA